MAKKSKRIDLAEAVKRMQKSVKRETGTPPKPYQPARGKAPVDGGISISRPKRHVLPGRSPK